MKEHDARNVIKTIAKTLKFCHENGVAHRDVKADNVLIGKQGRLKLIDFAYSHMLDDGSTVENYCGTPSYMSPEIFEKTAHCPKKADVWALGILAYRLVTGEFPFIGRLKHLTLAATKTETLETVVRGGELQMQRIEDKSYKFQSFIESVLVKNADKRPSIKEVLKLKWLADE